MDLTAFLLMLSSSPLEEEKIINKHLLLKRVKILHKPQIAPKGVQRNEQ